MSRPGLIYTLNGTDGAGKTSLGEALTQELNATTNGAFLMRGLGYAEWDDPMHRQHAEDLVGVWKGKDDEYVELPGGGFVTHDTAKRLSFQYIASRCYKRAQIKAVNEGVHTIIDSDPYLKGIMWAIVLGNSDDVVASWNDVVADPSTKKPDTMIHIVADHDAAIAAPITLRRIRGRGEISPFDPKNEPEALRRIAAAEATAAIASTQCDIKIITIANTDVQPRISLTRHLRKLTDAIIGTTLK